MEKKGLQSCYSTFHTAEVMLFMSVKSGFVAPEFLNYKLQIEWLFHHTFPCCRFKNGGIWLQSMFLLLLLLLALLCLLLLLLLFNGSWKTALRHNNATYWIWVWIRIVIFWATDIVYAGHSVTVGRILWLNSQIYECLGQIPLLTVHTPE